jgi:dipeptidyl aminopeptidase/acylaminoacyl peptidase
MLRELESKGLYERSGWPAQARPDIRPPRGWSLPLITSVGRPRSHSLSPDGRRIAFVWDRGDASNLYVMPTEGGWPLRVTPDREARPYWFDDPPQWSADGRYLAFTDRDHVWIVPVDGGLPRKVTSFTTHADIPRWMPDNYQLLVTVERDDRTRILLTDRDGSWPRPVSEGPGHDYSPQASPDGRYVAYLHGPLEDLDRCDIMLADLETGLVRPLTGTPGREDTAPDWSPDGRYLAFTSERPGFNELFLIDLSTGSERQVTHLGHDVEDHAWSPDGTRIVCTVNRDGALDLAVVAVASGRVDFLRSEGGVHRRPQWLADHRNVIFEYEDPRAPADLYRIDAETRQVTQLTFSNPPALQALDLAAPELVRFPSFDGLEIPAVLYRPRKSNGAAILYPHGGPTSQYTLEWDIWAQYMVAKGYTWLAPNFRGSTGYGLEFERANHSVWGVDDTKDCLAGAEYLASMRGMDSQRLAIYGASYGSYLVVCALAADPPTRFACGIAKYGDCNILTSWAQGDRETREDLERMMGHPTSDRNGYRVGSPVTRVANIQSPLLIVHGLLDPIVHPLQSQELLEALKREKKTFEYKAYPDEGHGLLLRKNQLDFYALMERFVDWYLL